MKAKFTFHSVGQGLFYSGLINTGDELLSLVYDCGSLSKGDFLKNEIFNLINELNFKLNLLVISHFHADHINGLNYLLAKLQYIDTIVLPYLNPLERLIIAFLYPYQEDWYYKFLENPIEFIFKSYKDKIDVG